MNTLTIGLVQQRCSENTVRNLENSIARIEQLAGQGAELIVLQELHRSLYFCQQEEMTQFDLAETIPGPSTERLGKLAAKNNIVIVASLFEKRAVGLYHNTALVFERDGSIAGTYRKMHIPDDPGFYEKFYFTPGDLGFEPIHTSVGCLGVLICWDQWFPEAARLMATAGADILIYPTAIGWDPRDDEAEKQRQLEAWICVQRGHAIANGLPLISVNRVGLEKNDREDEGIHFWGNSFVCGPQGEVIHLADQGEEENGLVEIDLTRTETVRRTWPFLRDRRVDYYTDIKKIFRK